MKSTNHLKRYALDIGGILLLLIFGFVLYTGFWRNLYWTLTPRPPVLLQTEWEGSSMDLLNNRVIGNGYEYKVELIDRYYVKNNNWVLVAISQTTNWYTDSRNALHAWQNPHGEINEDTYRRLSKLLFDVNNRAVFLNEFYAKPLPADIPILSSLRCYDWDESLRICAYFGYYEHWFTQIWFRGSGDKNVLTDELMFELIEKAVKIIIESPPPRP